MNNVSSWILAISHSMIDAWFQKSVKDRKHWNVYFLVAKLKLDSPQYWVCVLHTVISPFFCRYHVSFQFHKFYVHVLLRNDTNHWTVGSRKPILIQHATVTGGSSAKRTSHNESNRVAMGLRNMNRFNIRNRIWSVSTAVAAIVFSELLGVQNGFRR